MQPETLQCGLSREQLEAFHRDGYLVIDHVLDDGDLQPLIDEVQTEIDRGADEFIAAGTLSQSYREHGFERQLAMIAREVPQLARSIWNGKLTGPAFFDLIRNPKLLDVAESLCGPELIGSAVYRLRPKLPKYRYGEVPWHQDSSYMEPACDRFFIPTMWIPLVDATQERGCLWVIPGAHRRLLKHVGVHDQYLEINAAELDGLAPLCVPVAKGSVLLMHNLLPHASFENASDAVRYTVDIRYQSAVLPTNAPFTRMAGDSRPDPENGIPATCYPPEADFLVRSRSRPHEVVADHAVFERIRREHLRKPVTVRWVGQSPKA
jgi:phytanoyl-CoA hydroxylase